MDPRHPTAAGLAAVTLFAAGCGGGGGDGNGGALNKADYIAKADQICQNVNDSLAAIGTPQNAQQLAAYVQKALPQIDAAVGKLKRLDAADDIRPAAQELIRNLQRQRDFVRQVGVKAKKQDVKGISELSTKAADFAQATAKKAKAAGFQTCGVPPQG